MEFTDIPAFLREGGPGGLEAPGGPLNVSRDISVSGRRMAGISLRVNRAGHCILGVGDSGKGRTGKRKGPTFPVWYSEWAFTDKRPDLSDGGLRLPGKEDGLYRFEPLHAFAA